MKLDGAMCPMSEIFIYILLKLSIVICNYNVSLKVQIAFQQIH